MTGYTEAYILGKNRGLKFGMLAIENIAKDLESLKAITGEEYSSEMVAVLTYWGIENNAYVKREKSGLTFEEVVDWVGDQWFNPEGKALLADIVKCFEESQLIRNLSAQQTGEVKKKKAGKS
jgi:hypothetical protein